MRENAKAKLFAAWTDMAMKRGEKPLTTEQMEKMLAHFQWKEKLRKAWRSADMLPRSTTQH